MKILNVFADSERFDPLKSFNFKVSFIWRDGSTFMSTNFGFSKISGLNADVDVVEYREGGDNLSTRKMAGLVKFDPLVFEKGMTDNKEMWNAFKKIFNIGNANQNLTESSRLDAEGYRGTLLLEIQNRKKTTVRTIEVRKAWISRYEIGDLDAQGSNILVERITIQHEGFQDV